jgi:hypothetical protein
MRVKRAIENKLVQFLMSVLVMLIASYNSFVNTTTSNRVDEINANLIRIEIQQRDDYRKIDDKFDLYLTKLDHSNVNHDKLVRAYSWE